MILLVDNYGSFSYNVYHLIGSMCRDIKVVRNDSVTVADIRELAPSCLVLSPGPGRPSDAGICIETVKQFHAEIPIMGICLGHQAICEAFGSTITYAKRLMHGKSSEVTVDTNNALFEGLPSVIRAGRYHSLAAAEDTLPDFLRVTARTGDGEIMAVCHEKYPVYGVQFHPESILTPDGKAIVRNFMRETAV